MNDNVNVSRLALPLKQRKETHMLALDAQAIDDRRVRYLYEACQSGSVRAAADKLDMNPSVVSRQISKLELELGVLLLERLGRGVRPTEAGQMVCDYFRQQRAHQDDLFVKLQEIRGLARGHIDLVLGEGFVSDLMGEPLQSFWQRHPELTVSLRVAGTNEILRQVAEDEAHIGLVYYPPATSGIRSRAAIRQPMCAITTPDHPLATMQRQPMLKHITAYPVALMHGAYGTRQIVALAEQMDNLRLSPKLTTDSFSVAKQFCSAGLGVGLMPAFAVSQELATGALVATPIDNIVLARAEAHIVTRLGRSLSAAANQLLLHLTSRMQAFQRA